jgi:DNA invertase Pin-like site-specific DNA recombinase/Skp family chaperone for outer membrane proteins
MIRNRALIYIRKSIVRNEADTVSPERQREACREEARRHGWVVGEGDVYADAEGHQSGRDDQRPDWQRLRRRLRHDESIAAVIVESLSRASRSVRSFFEFVEELRARGVGLVSLKERFDTSNAIGQAMLGFIAVVNQLESDLASERMQSNIAFKKSRGRHWGLTPFGCRRAPGSGALGPSEETYSLDGEERRYYDALVTLYETYCTGAHGFKTLARALNADGWRFRGRQGQPRAWDEHNTRSVLMLHRVYAGWVPLDGPNKDAATHADPATWVPANYPPVLPVALCDAVQATLAERSHTWRLPEPKVRERSEPSPFILTGILHCAACGQRLKGYTARGASAVPGRRHYRHERRGDCPQTWHDAEALEEGAVAILHALRLPPEVGALLVEVLVQGLATDVSAELQAEVDALDAELQAVDDEQKRLVQLAIRTGLNNDIYDASLRELEARRSTFLARQRRLQERQRGEKADLSDLVERLAHVSEALAQAQDPRVRRDLVSAILARVEAADGQIVSWSPRDWCKPFF